MHSTFVYSLKLSVLRGAGGKALATDHREVTKQIIMCHCGQLLFLSSSDRPVQSLDLAASNRRPSAILKILNEGKLLCRRINNVATLFMSYLSANQRFLQPRSQGPLSYSLSESEREDPGNEVAVFETCPAYGGRRTSPQMTFLHEVMFA